jgi:hypothetical protein
MAEGKNIEIKIAASGGEQAAAELRKTESGIKNLQSQINVLAELDYSPKNAAALEQLNADLEKAKENYRDLATAVSEAEGEQDSFAQKSNIAGAAMVGVGIGGAVVSKVFREIAQGLNSLDIEKLREMDAGMAEQVETARGWAEVLTDPINGIQRLISGNTIGEAFADVNTQLALNAQMQAEAIDRIIQNGRKTAAETKALAQEIAAANAILAAKDAADSAERDAADAARVRGGKHPEDVQAERAAYDRDRKLEQIDRGLEPKAATTQTLFDDARQAVINEERVKQDPRATREDVAKAVKEAEDARKAADAAKKEYDAAAAVAAEQRRGVRAAASGKIDELGAEKRERIGKEREKLAHEGEQEIAKALRKEEAAKRKADAEQKVAAGQKLAATSFEREERGGRESGSLNLKSRAEAAMKGQGSSGGDGESEMVGLVQRLVSWAEGQGSQGGGSGVSAKDFALLKRQVENLEGRGKAGRTPGR